MELNVFQRVHVCQGRDVYTYVIEESKGKNLTSGN